MTYQPTITDLPKRLPGENDKIYWKRAGAFLRGDDVRSKGDLRGWASCIFHLSNEVARQRKSVRAEIDLQPKMG